MAMKDEHKSADAIQDIVKFMHGYSLEATRPTADEIAALPSIVPAGTRIYLSAVPGQRTEEIVAHATRVRCGGFEPVPHLAVRGFESAAKLERVLRRLAAEAGVRCALVIAGDRDPPVGSLHTTLDVIDGGMLARHGICEVGIAGYPEGHPKIPPHELDRALASKIAAAKATGLKIHIVTQFAFDASAIIGWVRRLRSCGLDVPVRIGLAGPTSLPTLMRYATRCGVGASVQGLARNARLLRQLFAVCAPDALVRALAAEREHLGDVRPHFFSFGGLIRTARWVSTVQIGLIALEAGEGFRVEPAA